MDAIICMAGSGTRLNLDYNKAFLKLNEIPLFLYSVITLAKYVDTIYLSVRKEDIDLITPYLNQQIKCVIGGKDREESVYNAMKEIPQDNLVLVHDAARPFLSDRTLRQIVSFSKTYDLVLPYLKAKYTTYQKEPLEVLDRSNLIIAQTPQLVKASDFILSYEKALLDNFKATDDVSLVLKYTQKPVALVLDEETNIKITTPYDLEIAKLIISKR